MALFSLRATTAPLSATEMAPLVQLMQLSLPLGVVESVMA